MAKTFVVEHLDPELGPWSLLEYKAIAQECYAAGDVFCLSSVSEESNLPPELRSLEGLKIQQRKAEDIYARDKARVCLLDPAAKSELSPTDQDRFDVFLFGGILGDDPPRGKCSEEHRTSELRKQGFEGRRLGPVQMTTDTAVRVTRRVVQEQVKLESIPYIDFPELKFNEHESTEMPFRYIKDSDGKPIMPQGMMDLIKADADKGLDDLL